MPLPSLRLTIHQHLRVGGISGALRVRQVLHRVLVLVHHQRTSLRVRGEGETTPCPPQQHLTSCMEQLAKLKVPRPCTWKVPIIDSGVWLFNAPALLTGLWGVVNCPTMRSGSGKE